jgi:DNA-directed RNA polymerase beta subunit
MIPLNKLRLFPFRTKSIALDTLKGLDNYNIFFQPENSFFIDTYPFLNIQKRFIRKATIVPSVLPKMIISSKTFIDSFKGTGLIPIRKTTDLKNNVFIDGTPFFKLLEDKFGAGSYRRPFMFGRVLNYYQIIKELDSDRKNVLLYYLDSTKEFPNSLVARRIFPLLYYIYKNKTVPFFDYILFANKTMDGEITYSLLSSPDQAVNISRIWSLFKSLQSPTIEEKDTYKEDMVHKASQTLTQNISEPQDNSQLILNSEQVIKGFLKDQNVNVPEQVNISSDKSLPVAVSAIISGFTGNSNKAIQYTSQVPVQELPSLIRRLKQDILPEIVVSTKYKNKSRDIVFRDAKIHEVNNKEPSKLINKRFSDFNITFEKDLKNSFDLLKNSRFPLTLTKFTKADVPVENGDLEPSDLVSYFFTLKDDLGHDHSIEIDIPKISDNGTFLINGKRKFLIYQIVIDPIYFIKPGQAKLETLYTAISIHHKKTIHKSYYEIYMAGYELPLFLLLSYFIGFDGLMKLFNIRYKITTDQPPQGTVYVVLSDGAYIWIDHNNDEASIRLINSFFEIKHNFTKTSILSKQEWQSAIVSYTRTRNSIFKIDKVIMNIMEPVAVQILKSKMEPTTLQDCIYYICKELATGRVDKRNDLGNQRIRSSEVFVYQIQKLILAAYTNYEFQRGVGDKNATFICETKKVVSDIVNSELVRDLENINPVEELSCLTRITPVGAGGIPDDRALTNKDRGLHESYYGNIDPMDTPEGGNVGLINQLSISASVSNARGTFGTSKDEDERAGSLSPSSVFIPYVGSCDGNRVMFSCSQSKQTIPINGKEQPLVQSGYETSLTPLLSESFVKKSPVDGVIIKQTDATITIKSDSGKNYKVPLESKVLISRQGQDSLNIFKSIYSEGTKVEKDQIVAEGKYLDNGVICLGTNLLTAIMGWKGFSYEDGYVISDRIAKQKLTSESYDEIVMDLDKDDIIKFVAEEGKMTQKGEPLIIRSSSKIETLAGVEEDELVEGQIIKKSPGGKIIEIQIYPNINIKRFPVLITPFLKFKAKYEEVKGSFPEKFLFNVGGEKIQFSGIRIVFKLERYEECVIGDKIANMHGGKGVIAYIEKEENMPRTPFGEHIQVILNPLSLINRMNPSTLYEMYTGLIAKFLAYQIVSLDRTKSMKLISQVYKILDRTIDKKLSTSIINKFLSLSNNQWLQYIENIRTRNYILPIIIPPFQAPSKNEILKALEIVGAAPEYYLTLPEYGIKTFNKVACGYMYFKKLEMQSEGKLTARSTGRYQEKTLQPVAGKKSGGGQRVGEFDTWAFAGHGAVNTLREFFGPLSDDQSTKDQIIYDIIQTGSAHYREPKTSPTRNMLEIYIRGMMLNTSLHNK